jgi:hypothetical protein
MEDALFGLVVEYTKLSHSKSVLNRCGLAKLLDSRLAYDRRIHPQHLLYPIENRGSVVTLRFLSRSTDWLE